MCNYFQNNTIPFQLNKRSTKSTLEKNEVEGIFETQIDLTSERELPFLPFHHVVQPM